MITRRHWIAKVLAAAPASKAVRPKGVLIDTHIHLFDPQKYAYHKNATYRPAAQTLDAYVRFVREAGIDHAIVVHPEPYQDDHSYLEYCFLHEPFEGFFKGTCLFDPIAPETPAQMEALARKLPARIVALRIHETQSPGKRPTTSGAIRDRDMRSPAMLTTWRKAASLGLAIQMHFIPHYAPQIRALASKLPEMPVILDHLGRYGEGTRAEYDEVLRLADLPRVYMKFSAVRDSSTQQYPYSDAKPLIRRVFQAFGSGRIIWGGLGMDLPEFRRQAALLEEMFDFADEAARANIRGLNAARLFGFSA
jgi:predicted TIM-barrel fold metal-dependent hydrolase